MPNNPTDLPDSDWRFIRRLLLIALFGLLGLALFKLSKVLLLMFASVLVAVLLCAMVDVMVRWLRLPRPLALTLAVALCLGVMGGFLMVFGTQIYQQVQAVAEILPGMVDDLAERMGIDWRTSDVDLQALASNASQGMAGNALGYGFGFIGILTDVVLMSVGGLFLAANPRLYLGGLARLVPLAHRPLFDQAMCETGQALKQWLAGQLFIMLCVGLASWAAYSLIGLPSAGGLALIAGMADFVPFIGPVIGALPALVVGLTQDWQTLLWVLLAVLVIQQLESYVLVPLIQKHAVKMPPFLGIFSILIFGALFGLMGILLAIPITVALMVLVQRLWVNEALGDDMPVIGQKQAQ